MKDYSFIDMHIHTEYSDEDMCDITIEQVLAKAQKRAEKTNQDCVIAIADHNTIMGAKRAKEILQKEGSTKYPNVKLINGIEFTTDLIEMNDYFDGVRTFTRCHTLAYGYDENNAELIAYSKIAHLTYTKDDNVGIQICAARRKINEIYNINIPFGAFVSMVNLPSSARFKEEFKKCLKEYAKENKITLNMADVDRHISPYILDYVDYVREASAMGRLKISDVATLVKNAGGELVIAHPCLINVTTAGMRKIAEKEGKELSDIYIARNSKYLNNSDLSYVQDRHTVLNYFLDAYEKVCGFKVSGIEKYYSTNFASRMDTVIADVCAKRGMYETAGSDYHGEHLHPYKKIGKVFSRSIEASYIQDTKNEITDNTPLVVAGLTAVDHLTDKKPLVLPNDTIIKNAKGEVIPKAYCEKILNVSVNVTVDDNYQKLLDKKREDLILYLNDRLGDLAEIARRFDEIAAHADSPKKQAKLLLKLNLFAENVMLGIRELQRKTQKHQKIIEFETYKQITEVLDDVRGKFQRLLRHNPRIIQELKHDMKHYYNKRTAVISSLVNVKLTPAKVATDTNTKNNTESEMTVG